MRKGNRLSQYRRPFTLADWMRRLANLDPQADPKTLERRKEIAEFRKRLARWDLINREWRLMTWMPHR